MKKGLPAAVYLLGLVSFLTDISSEMIFSVFVLFLTLILGAATPLVGLIEGVADTSASLFEVFSGYLSDHFRKRKPLVVFGYGLSAAAKVILAFASTIGAVFSFRILDRFGKGIRTAPRDALIAGITKKEIRGKAFGVHRALDTSGAVIGPLIAYWLLSKYGQTAGAFKTIFTIAIIPAVLAVLVLAFTVGEKPARQTHKKLNLIASFKLLSSQFKRYLLCYGLFSLAYFSFAFLLLRAYTLGFLVKDVILLYLVYNVVFALAATPVGILSDKIGRKTVLFLGFLLYALLCTGFAFVSTKFTAALLFGVYGVFLAIDESVGRAYAADLAQPRIRATAMGTLNTVTGIIYLPASLIAGLLWRTSPALPFLVAAGIAIFAALLLFIFVRER
jgi:MFS family permease